MKIKQLNQRTLRDGLKYLAHIDQDLARIVNELGTPPLWTREPGFPTLIQIILEQQVSLASAKAAFQRLVKAVNQLTPATFLTLDNDSLKTIGFSRQKTVYCRELATAIIEKRFDVDALAIMSDEEVREELIKLKGIGMWTADIYLIMALRRPDAWPYSDLALAVSLQRNKNLSHRPGSAEILAFGEAWRPWRAVAAHVLWHDYLTRRVKI